MARQPYAAKVLFDEVVEHVNADATMEPHGEPDGFGVYRTFRFDKRTALALPKLLHALGDERILEFTRVNRQLEVTFAADASADRRWPFDLEAAKTVAEDGTSSPEE